MGATRHDRVAFGTLGGGRPRSPRRPRRRTGSAVAASPSAWAWAARFGDELSKTGEPVDNRRRGRMLDESLEILTAAWSGEPVSHHGEHHTIDTDTVEFLPRPIRRPGVPVWVAGFPGNPNPLHRAARRAPGGIRTDTGGRPRP
jgi:Luciferase-like monooxygenase